jgi:hypothetical protein
MKRKTLTDDQRAGKVTNDLLGHWGYEAQRMARNEIAKAIRAAVRAALRKRERVSRDAGVWLCDKEALRKRRGTR